MLRIVLLAAALLSSGTAYALNNSDVIQLNLRLSRHQGQPQPDLLELLEPAEQGRLQQQRYLGELLAQRQQEQVKQTDYRQQLLFEWQRRQEARRSGEERVLDILMQREQSGLFQ